MNSTGSAETLTKLEKALDTVCDETEGVIAVFNKDGLTHGTNNITDREVACHMIAAMISMISENFDVSPLAITAEVNIKLKPIVKWRKEHKHELARNAKRP